MVMMSRAQQRLFMRGGPIFTYHKIGDAPKGTRDSFLYTRAPELERQLALLIENGFQPVNLDDTAVSPGLALKKFAVTFDDGFQNVFENGFEILRRHQVCAIQFLVSGAIGKRNDWDVAKGDLPEPLMNTTQVKQWLAAGHQIGSHSMTHRNLKKLSTAEAREEIFGSKKSLEDSFGVPVRHFCYPFGGWTAPVRDLVVEAGYQTACTVDFGVNDNNGDRFVLKRIIPLSRGDLLRKVFHRLFQRVGLA